jgi:hypothetical protein
MAISKETEEYISKKYRGVSMEMGDSEFYRDLVRGIEFNKTMNCLSEHNRMEQWQWQQKQIEANTLAIEATTNAVTALRRVVMSHFLVLLLMIGQGVLLYVWAGAVRQQLDHTERTLQLLDSPSVNLPHGSLDSPSHF